MSTNSTPIDFPCTAGNQVGSGYSLTNGSQTITLEPSGLVVLNNTLYIDGLSIHGLQYQQVRLRRAIFKSDNVARTEKPSQGAPALPKGRQGPANSQGELQRRDQPVLR